MSDAAELSWTEAISEMRWRVAVFLLSCMGVGVVAGVIWALGAFRPSYEVADDLAATMGERGLVGIFAADAFFSVMMVLVGLAIGVACWMLFHRNGWWVCMLSVVGAGIAGVLAWQVGLLVTPDDFPERLAKAVGGMVPVDLQLRATAALLVGPFAAITPVMLFAAFAPEPRPRSVVVEQDWDVGHDA